MPMLYNSVLVSLVLIVAQTVGWMINVDSDEKQRGRDAFLARGRNTKDCFVLSS